MALTRDEVVFGYRYLLGREPENDAVVDDHARGHPHWEAFRATLVASDEYRGRQREFLPTLAAGYITRLGSIAVAVDEDVRARLFDRIQAQWKALGETEPYWSVLTDDRYRTGRMTPRLREHFLGSGKLGAELIDLFENAAGRTMARGTCLEIGCGVGRLTAYLARKFEHVVAVDISPGNLAIARDVLAEAGVDNVELRLVETIDDFDRLPEHDVFFSMIALQHNPPPIQARLLEALLPKVRRGGGCLFQTVTDLPGYDFEPAAYLASPSPEMEVHALPQVEIMRLLRLHDLSVQAVRMDPWVDTYGSNTFFALRD